MNPRSRIWNWILAVTAAAALSLSVAIATHSQVCPGCETSQQNVTKADNRLNLDDDQKDAAEARHLLGGRPTAPADATNEHLIHQREWVTWYDDDLRVPIWVAYELTKADAKKHLERLDCFRKDPRLNDGAASICEDYEEPIFDRGHMAPSADMSRGRLAQTNSFIFSNMTPQHDRFNRGIWARFEDRVRKWAIASDGVYVVTGAVFDKDGDGQRDADNDVDLVSPTNRVGIPTAFYKIILHVRPSGFIDTISILLPHTDENIGATNSYLSSHIVTIDEIEGLTGIDFFPGLPDDLETATESFEAAGLWHTG